MHQLRAMPAMSSTQSATDQQLVEQAKRGNKHAFDLLVLRYQHKILRVARRYIDDPHEAQDVAQDTFVRAYMALPRFREKSTFYTWLYRIAVNTAKGYFNKPDKKLPVADISAEDAESFYNPEDRRSDESAEMELMREDLKKATFQAVAALPEDLRITITLREMDGFSYREISEIVECPVGTVRSRIFRAREAVEEQIRPLLEEGRKTKERK